MHDTTWHPCPHVGSFDGQVTHLVTKSFLSQATLGEHFHVFQKEKLYFDST